jgi:glycosyltransferase involved in cell wall biosynthesis
MTKVLVLSYFFPPCTQTASNRVFAIVSHLKELGYHPIVVTRNWDLPISIPKDSLRSTGKDIKYIENELYEAYYLPYKSSLRDLFYIYSDKIFLLRYLSKAITFLIYFLELFSTKFIPYSNLYKFSKQLIENDIDIKFVFISANPFMLFKFGYKLNKSTSIPWVADYRDAWTTNEMSKKERLIYRIIYFFQKKFEKKWVSTAAFFTTVSKKYVQNINQLVPIPGIYIYNGINNYNDIINKEFQEKKVLKVIYSGSLYSNQDVESLLLNIYKLNERLQVKIEISFVGVGYNKLQQSRIINSSYFTEYVKVYPWISKSELKSKIESSDILLLLSYKGFDGIPTSKLFDYLSYKKPIFLYPTDNGILKTILSEVGSHHILNSERDLIEILTLYSEDFNSQFKKFSINKDNLDKYLTINQVKRLVNKINTTL